MGPIQEHQNNESVIMFCEIPANIMLIFFQCLGLRKSQNKFKLLLMFGMLPSASLVVAAQKQQRWGKGMVGQLLMRYEG